MELGGVPVTICAWAVMKSFQNYQRVVDFGNGANSNNFMIAAQGNTATLLVGVYHTGGNTEITVNNFWELNKWTHVCATLNSSLLAVYADGELLKTTENRAKQPWRQQTYQNL